MAGEPLHNLPKMLVLVVLARRVCACACSACAGSACKEGSAEGCPLVASSCAETQCKARWMVCTSSRELSADLPTFLSLLSSAAPEKDEIMFMSKTRRWVIISQQRAHFWLWSVSTGG